MTIAACTRNHRAGAAKKPQSYAVIALIFLIELKVARATMLRA
jgi:hypothetical protein